MMMNLILIKLARFITSDEQKYLAKDIKRVLNPITTSYRISYDEWGAKKRILVEVELEKTRIRELGQNLLEQPGIIAVIHFSPRFYNWESSSLSPLINQISTFLTIYNQNATYSLDFRTIGKVPFHKKAIIDRLRKNNFEFHSHSKFHLYIEIRSFKEKNTQNLQTRIGRKFIPEVFSKENLQISPQLVIYSPYTEQEIADFFRLGLVFKLPLIFTDENKNIQGLIKRTQKTYFKGISKVSHKIIPSLEVFIKNNVGRSFGFSLWGTKSVHDLPSIIQPITNQDKEKPIINLIFGNEQIGLPLFVHNQIPMFHIGGYSSEPLRASQAASYALGTLGCLKKDY